MSCFFLLFLVSDPRKQQEPLSYKAKKETKLVPPQKIPSQPTSPPKKPKCLKNVFSDILLVIIYNHPLYDSADLLREFYKPVFPHIYVCGALLNVTYDIHSSAINKGIYGYKCLADAIHAHQGFSGYLYINDDVIVNYWNLIKFGFDFSKIGESSNQFGKVSIHEAMPTNWYWWISPYGFKNCKSAINEIKLLSESFQFYNTSWKNFEFNGRGDHFCHNGRSDIVYIPGLLSRAFYEISNVFYKYHCFLEIAVPTILRFLAREKDISTLHGMYLPGDVRKKDPRVTDSRYFWTTYLKKASLWFIHPFKLHHYEDHNRDLNIELMKRIMIRKTKELTDCAKEDVILSL